MSAPAEQETKPECATSNDLRRTARGYYSAGMVRYDALGARLEVLASALDALAAAKGRRESDQSGTCEDLWWRLDREWPELTNAINHLTGATRS